MNSTIITVKNGATLAGVTLSGSTAACPTTTVESGGSIAPGTPGQIFVMSDVLLETGTNLNFTFSALGDTVDTIYANTVSSVGGGPITVNVNYTDVPASAVTPLMYGVIASNITFTLSGGVPVFDSSDGVTAPATLDASSGSELDLIKGGILADSVPGWNAAGGGNWTENDKWVNDLAPIVHLHPDGGGDRGLFVKNLGGAAIPISLDISPRLSSMIFASPSGESYTITPSASGKTITLDSGIAQNWHITVLGGSHTVAADMKLGAGTGAFAGQSVIRLVDDSHLTLSGVLSDETTAVGVNFVGNFNGGAGTGVLTLNGANTYTGPTIVTNGVLEAATIANRSLGEFARQIERGSRELGAQQWHAALHRHGRREHRSRFHRPRELHGSPRRERRFYGASRRRCFLDVDRYGTGDADSRQHRHERKLCWNAPNRQRQANRRCEFQIGCR